MPSSESPCHHCVNLPTKSSMWRSKYTPVRSCASRLICKDSTCDDNHARHVMAPFIAVKRAVIRIRARFVEFMAKGLSRRERGRGPGTVIRRHCVGAFFVLPDHFRSGFDGGRLRLELVIGENDLGSSGRLLLESFPFVLRERGRGA